VPDFPSVEWLSRRIVESTGDAMLYAGRDGRILYWNGAAEAIFGWTSAEAVGQSMDLIIPDRLRARHWAGWEKSMATGVTRYSGQDLLAVPAQRKDGKPLSIEFTIQLIRDDAGELVGAAAVVRDVTARWNQDRDLRRRLKELEAQLAK
jgi:PAS domain S-box-containing protein